MRQQDAALGQLRAALARTGRVPVDFLKDQALLEALVDLVRDSQRRQARWYIGLLVLAGVLLPCLGLPEPLPQASVIGLLVATPTTLLFALEPHGVREKALSYLKDTLLSRTTVDHVPGLLALSDALKRTSGDPDNVAYQVLLAAHTRLLYLLPHFTDTKSLAETERRTLGCLARWYAKTRPELSTVALLLLSELGDASLRRKARGWSQSHPDERFQEAAVEYLRLTEKQP